MLRQSLAAARKNSSTRASRSGRRLPRNARSAAKRDRAGPDSGRRIQRVVDRHAFSGAERQVCVHDGFAAAVGKNHVVAGNRRGRDRQDRVDAVQRCRRIHVPECDQALGPLAGRAPPLPEFIEHADTAGFDNQVGAARLLERAVPLLHLAG